MIEILYTKLQFCNLCIRWNNLFYTHQKPVFTQLPFNCIVIFWGVLSVLFRKRQFCMICFVHVVISSQNFSQHLWVTVHRLQVYACVEGFLYRNVLYILTLLLHILTLLLYILTLLLYTQTFSLYRVFLKKCISPSYWWTWQSSLCKHWSLDVSSLHYGPFPWQEED